MQSALPKQGILEKKKTKGGHTSLHFKSKYKDILTEAQTKDMFNRIGIPESDWHIYIGLTCGKVALQFTRGMVVFLTHRPCESVFLHEKHKKQKTPLTLFYFKEGNTYWS